MVTEDQVNTGSRPLLGTSLAVETFKLLTAIASWFPDSAHVEQVDEEVIAQLTRAGGEDTVLGSIPVSVQRTQTTDQDGQFRGGEGQLLGFVDEELLGADTTSRVAVVAETIGEGPEPAE